MAGINSQLRPKTAAANDSCAQSATMRLRGKRHMEIFVCFYCIDLRYSQKICVFAIPKMLNIARSM